MVQKKSGDTSGCDTNGATCEQVKGSGSNQYPGPGWTGSASTFTSEQCDPADTKNSSSTKLTTNKLCNLANNTNYSDYNANSDISCSTSCTLINTDQCARCGDGDVGSGETCDIASNGDIMTASGNYGRKCNNDSWSTSQSTYWIVPANGQYKITVYGAQGGTGRGVSGGVGCNGAKVWGTFDLTKGETLYIRVGAQGANGADKYGGNGGGGSAVKKGGTQNGKDGTLMLVAGGGGGGG
ncbi:hypothetical protein J6Z19_05850, partial [bacterium]|nr:hypothetical protein [bacterium]